MSIRENSQPEPAQRLQYPPYVMTDPSGRITDDMKWFVYRYRQKPDTLMALGDILT